MRSRAKAQGATPGGDIQFFYFYLFIFFFFILDHVKVINCFFSFEVAHFSKKYLTMFIKT